MKHISPLPSKILLVIAKPEYIFLFFSTVFSFFILSISPPFQSPDEINHFLRSYQIADGGFVAQKKDQRVGGVLPESLTTFASHFYYLRWNGNAKIAADTILDSRNISLNADKKIFIDFPNTAMYSPVSYAPHALIIAVLRKFNASPFYIYYLTKLFVSAFWILLIFYSIKIIPFYKWGIAALALLPMSLYIHNSFSADLMTNSITYFFISYIFYVSIGDKKINKINIFLIILLSIIIGLAKIVYSPVLLLIFLIPINKFNNSLKYISFIFSSYFLSFIFILAWMYLSSNLYTPYSDYNPVHVQSPTTTLSQGASMPGQIAYIKANWSAKFVADFFYYSVSLGYPDYLEGIVGIFGWMDTRLPKWFIGIHYLFLAIVLVFDKKSVLKFNNRMLFILAILISYTLILISQYLTWEYVGSKATTCLQGRYLTPLLPLIYILFSFNKNWNKNLPVIIFIPFILFSTLFSLSTIYTRYYQPNYPLNTFVVADCETLHNSQIITTEPGISVDKGVLSVEHAHSGNLSVQTSPQATFGFPSRLFGLRQGDQIVVEVWRLGSHGRIAVNLDGGAVYKEFNPPNIIEKDDRGWEKIHAVFTMPDGFLTKEVGVYVYCPDGTAFFDDFSIMIRRK